MWTDLRKVAGGYGYVAKLFTCDGIKKYAFGDKLTARLFINSHGGFTPTNSCAVACILAGAGLHEEEV